MQTLKKLPQTAPSAPAMTTASGDDNHSAKPCFLHAGSMLRLAGR